MPKGIELRAVNDPDRGLIAWLKSLNGGEAAVFVPHDPPPGRLAVYIEPEGEGYRLGLYVGPGRGALHPKPDRSWFCNIEPVQFMKGTAPAPPASG